MQSFNDTHLHLLQKTSQKVGKRDRNDGGSNQKELLHYKTAKKYYNRNRTHTHKQKQKEKYNKDGKYTNLTEQTNRGRKKLYLVTMALKWSLYLAIERNLIQL